MTGKGLAPAGMGTAPQLSLEQPQVSPRRPRDELVQSTCPEGRNRLEADVDAEADVVDTLLTMREIASNASGNDRVLQIAVGGQGPSKRESAEDDQDTHRSDSAAIGPATGAGAGLTRDTLCAQRQSLTAGPGSGVGSRPNSGAASHSLASRPNSFTGKKRKPGIKEEEPANVSSQAAHFPSSMSGVAAAEAAALQLQQQLTAAAAAEALAWRPGAASSMGGGGGGQNGGLPGSVGRVASEPLINGGQRLPEAVLARLGLGALGPSVGDAAAIERLRVMVLGAVNANGAGDPAAPSAKRPHMLSRQTSGATAAAMSLSAEDLHYATANHHHQHQQQQQQQQHQLVLVGTTAGERPTSGRQEQRAVAVAQPSGAATVTVAAASGPTTGGSGEDASDNGLAAASGEALAGDYPIMTHGSGHPAAATGGAARLGLRQPSRRCTPPTPLGHHSDTGSDSGSPSTRAPYSPGKSHAATHGLADPHASRGGAADAAAAAAAAAADGDNPSAAPGLQITTSVISLLHALALRQQQHQQPLPQHPVQHQQGRSAAPYSRISELAELMAMADGAAGADGGMAGWERQGRGSRERERMVQPPHDALVRLGPEQAAAVAAAAAAAAAVGVIPGDVRDIAAAALYGNGKATAAQQQQQPRGGGGGGGGASGGGGGGLHRQMSYNSREPPHVNGVAAAGMDMMQVDSSSSPPLPLRTVSGVAEAHLLNPPAGSAAAAAGGRSAGPPADRAAGGGAAAMDTDVPLSAAAAVGSGGDERIHASLAAIGRKLLLQEERLVYELKQVRLMQKLLHVQQLKLMVREAMRGKERDAVAAAAGGADGLSGGLGSPFPTAAAPAAAVLSQSTEGTELGLARVASLSSHLLASAAARMAAAGGGGGGLPRQLSGVETLRTSSDAAALAAAAVHNHVDLPYGGHAGHYHQHGGGSHAGRLQSNSQLQQRRGLAAAEYAADVPDGSDELWSAAGATAADGGGRLLSYIAALSSSKGAAAALAAGGLAATSRRDAAAAAASSAVGGGQELALAALLDQTRHFMHTCGGGGGSDGGATGGPHQNGGMDVAHGGGAAPSEEEQSKLRQKRIMQVLLQKGQGTLQEQVLVHALAGGGGGADTA